VKQPVLFNGIICLFLELLLVIAAGLARRTQDVALVVDEAARPVGLLYVDGKHVTPTPIPIVGNRFSVEGKSYSCR